MRMARQIELPETLPTEMAPSHLAGVLETLDVAEGPGWPDSFGRALRRWQEEADHAPIRVLSLFTGAGGLDIGFHDAGFDVAYMLEIEPKFVSSLAANVGAQGYFGSCEILCTDIADFHPSHDLGIDLIIGGPPCQPFSAAGRRAAGGPGLHDPRGDLFREYIRIVEVVKPRAFVFENVYGLTGVQAGSAWRSVTSAFGSLGYEVSSRVIDAADYGVPQHRERLILVGTKGLPYLFPRPTHGPDSPGSHPYYAPEEALVGLQDEEKPNPIGGRWGHLLGDIPPGLNYSFYTSKMGHPNPVFAWRSKFSDFLYKADPCTPVRALKATGGQYTGPFHWDNRPFSIAELKRLQTIPDDYKLVGSRQGVIQQIGNSVPPQLARLLALSLLTQVWGIRIPGELGILAREERLSFRKRKAALTHLYRQKASAALACLPSFSAPSVAPNDLQNSYRGRVDMLSFDWQLISEENEGLSIKTDRIGNALYVQVAYATASCGEQLCSQAAVSLRPSKAGWDIPFREIQLLGHPLVPSVFVGLWKALEYHLQAANLKADLVQLSGYYQYVPRFTAEMTTFGQAPDHTAWGIVRQVVNGIGVRQQLHITTLAAMWEVPADVAGSALMQLRSLAYEVRGHSTNVSIPEGHFLIPYCYPTLHPRSVQLRKVLEV